MRKKIPTLCPNPNRSIIVRASIHLVRWFILHSLLHSFLPLHLILFYCFLLLSFVLQFRCCYFVLIFWWMMLCSPIYPDYWRRLAIFLYLFISIVTKRFFCFLLLSCLLSLVHFRQLKYFLLTFLSVNATHFFNFGLRSLIDVGQTQTNLFTFLLGSLSLSSLFFKVFGVDLTVDGWDLIEYAIKEI